MNSDIKKSKRQYYWCAIVSYYIIYLSFSPYIYIYLMMLNLQDVTLLNVVNVYRLPLLLPK
jgi:hypothetical protein